MKKGCIHAAFAVACVLPSLARPATAQADGTSRAKLVVFITVDQLATPYLERYRPEFTGGLRRMLDRGAFFDNAFHDHAVTETAPGHATLLSGRFPRSVGIVSNAAGVADDASPLLGGSGSGASPYRFRGSVLMDWLRSADPAARGLSVSRKDRGAILPFGRSHQPAFWYATGGRFTTSTYYADTLPAWVQEFNARRIPHGMAGRTWALLKPASQYSEPDSVPIEGGGRNFMFPHVLPATPNTAADQLIDFPFMDEVLLAFALDGMRANGLGSDDHADVLAVSFSTTDAIGHRYGPDSREIHDQILRLDRVLGDFIDSVYARVDSTRVIFALSSDHGVTRFPEVRLQDSAAAAAAHIDLAAAVKQLRANVAPHGIDSAAVLFDDGALEIDPAVLKRTGYDPTTALRKFVAGARAHPGVADAMLVKDLSRADTIRNTSARRWLHMLPPDTRVLAVVGIKEGNVWGRSRSAMHGSSTDADARVPIMFYGAAFVAGRFHDFVRTVDIAPTLAAVLGVTPTEKLDGRVLERALVKKRR